MGAVGHSGITVVTTGWFSLLDASQYIEKPNSHPSINFERGKKKSLAVFESRENNFPCLGVCVFCLSKGFWTTTKNKSANWREAGWKITVPI